jgi:hypothetical protein
MGQMRAALRSYAVEGLDPPELLAHLAAFTQVLEGDHLVTCLIGIHDAGSGTVTFASAGHPPPLRLAADGEAGYLDVQPGLPLGVPAALDRVDGSPAYPETAVKLPPGSTLLLFTDGLVEDRDVSVGIGMQQLAEAFAGHPPAGADDACSQALRVMGRDTSHDDDTAVLALTATDLVQGSDAAAGVPRSADPLEVTRVELAATPQAPAAARRAVTARLAEARLTDQVETAALLVSEVVTNALRHGGGPEELIVELDADGVSVGVRDVSPQPPRDDVGRGPGAVRVVAAGSRRTAAACCSSTCWRTAGAGGLSPAASSCGSGWSAAVSTRRTAATQSKRRPLHKGRRSTSAAALGGRGRGRRDGGGGRRQGVSPARPAGAGCLPAARGPRTRGSGGGRPGFGSRTACRPWPTG